MGDVVDWPRAGIFMKGKFTDGKIKIIDKANAKKYAFCQNIFYQECISYKNVKHLSFGLNARVSSRCAFYNFNTHTTVEVIEF
mgnify:CR=1 FL=1